METSALFLIVDHANDADQVHTLCKQYGISCHGIGQVEPWSGKEVFIPSKNLKSSGPAFTT